MKNYLAPNAHNYTTEKHCCKNTEYQASLSKQASPRELGKAVLWKSKDYVMGQ